MITQLNPLCGYSKEEHLARLRSATRGVKRRTNERYKQEMETGETYLGQRCKSNPEHGGKGEVLRFVRTKECVQCVLERRFGRAGKPKVKEAGKVSAREKMRQRRGL
jgi:hypothetical protein